MQQPMVNFMDAETFDGLVSRIIDERAMLTEQIKRIEQQINGLDRALTILLPKENAANESPRR